jgi:hypothetical protein
MAMKKYILFILLLSFISLSFATTDLGVDYDIVPIHQKLQDISIKNPAQTPLSCYISCVYCWIEGKYMNIYSETIDCVCKNQVLKPASQQYKEALLNSTIEEIIIYKDSIGYIIRREPNSSIIIIGICFWENNKWLFAGEDACFSSKSTDALQQIAHKAPNIHMPLLLKFYKQYTTSSDTLSFVNYLKTSGYEPTEYLINKLSNHKLTIYGEIHRRKKSWEILNQLILTPSFTEICSTIFMELPYHQQDLLDLFLATDTLNTDLIMKVLRNEQIYGWQDKGMYEFITTLWAVNKQSKNKIKIIAVDEQTPWDSIKTAEEYEYYVKNKLFDRDSIMANIIAKNIKQLIDSRNALFIVGMNHARKSSPNYPVKAGTLLAEHFQKEDIFSIMTHTMISDNINNCGRIRYGLFDVVFEKNGNTPTAFDLYNSPFGKETFDAVQSIRFAPSGGCFEDFYDGYIFLSPLNEEAYDYTLYELFTDEFVEELKRRALISKNSNAWYDIPIAEISKEKIIENIKIDAEKRQNKRWTELE